MNQLMDYTSQLYLEQRTQIQATYPHNQQNNQIQMGQHINPNRYTLFRFKTRTSPKNHHKYILYCYEHTIAVIKLIIIDDHGIKQSNHLYDHKKKERKQKTWLKCFS
ncbi:hypothetical protein AMTRI_Chr07g77950 [Amborella trichopoda]